MSVETPSGKSAATENFPVGSWLLPARLRPHVACFYAFARAIDDIADSSALSPQEKLHRLDGFAAALNGETEDSDYAKAKALRLSLSQTNTTPQHGLDLISAFKQDAVKNRYENWDELIDYCNRSAAPVGRYLLDLHGEEAANYRYSDALCNALQVINHLQDLGEDRRTLDRIYLPQDWMRAAGCENSALDAAQASIALRHVIDQCLEGCVTLMRDANTLAARLNSRRLAAESAAISAIARKLIVRLFADDPLAMRVKLGKPALFGAMMNGVARLLLP